MNSNWPSSDSKVTVLLIVAHPDDDTIFCGGTILSHPNWNWNIVCVTTQPGRSQEFRTAMEMYKSFGVNISFYRILEKPDENQDLTPEVYEEWSDSINILNLKPDFVITHNEMGEYGHKHHVAISKMVRELFLNVWEFVYPGDVNITPQPRKSKVIEVTLDPNLLEKKKQIFNDSYRSQIYVWQNLQTIMEYEFGSGPEVFISDSND